MTLRSKTLLFIGITLFSLILILYSITRGIVQGGFRKVEKDLVNGFTLLEDDDARRNVSRVLDALDQTMDNLAIKASDWSQWDDTYKFVQDHNSAYAQSNLEISSVMNLKINYILILNTKGELVAGVGLDLAKEEAMPLSEGLKSFIKPGSAILRHDSLTDVKIGLLMLDENPLMFASRPILKSDGTGPIQGTLIFARYLDDTEFEKLATLTHLSLLRHMINDTAMPSDFKQAKTHFSDSLPVCINPLNEKTISGYASVPDFFQMPAFILRVDIPRDVYKQSQKTASEIRQRGKVTLLSLIISILASGIILGLVILFILEKLVLSRIGRLSTKAVEIGTSGNFKGRVEAEGQDEIHSLSQSINKMLEALSQTHDAIESRNAEMRLLMDTIPAGLLSLDENFRINPEHSQSALKMLYQDALKGRSFAEVLGFCGELTPKANQLLDYLDMVRQELASAATLAELNPFDEIALATHEGIKWLRLRFFLIRRLTGLPHILVVIEDITEEKTLAQEVNKSHQENLQLKAIAEDPDLFREFLMETRKILNEVSILSTTLSPDTENANLINEIFRHVHTIKGVSGSFGLFQVAATAGELEDKLEVLRNGGRISANDIRKTRTELELLESTFSEVAKNAKKILGEDLEGGSGIFLRIPLDELKKYIHEIHEMTITENLKDKMIDRVRDQILHRLRTLTTVPARKGLARAVKIVPGLIERLEKDIRFEFEGQEIPIDCETAHELNTPLIHLLRNAFDHGIEPLDDRLSKGKPEQGVVTLSVSHEDHLLKLVVSDDGAGLDPEKLKATALKKGLITQEELKFLSGDRAFGLIFRAGFSTAEKVSDVSGRGVGMDTVLESVRTKLKGEIEVDSKLGEGTRFIIKIPK